MRLCLFLVGVCVCVCVCVCVWWGGGGGASYNKLHGASCNINKFITFVTLTPERSVKRPLFFYESSKLYFDLHDKIEEESFDKNNENLKYLNDVSGNLLQIFEGKDITSVIWRPMSKFFMSETLCHFFAENENKRNVMREEIK